MPEGKTYQKYLQQILNTHSIPFLTESEYEKQKQVGKVSQTGPLQMNISPPLSSDLIRRYSRQMLLKQISYEGQVLICEAKIALIGSGGIGCPLAMYLAAAGVGTIGLFDSDTVDQTNLHRQIGHRTSSIGQSKTSSLASTLLQINPHIKIKQHPFITVNTCSQLDRYDLVIDGSDNPMCRYIVNDYCMSKERKLLSGACVGWEAQISCFGKENLCYRCLWGDQQVSLGGCSTLGVVGPLPGIVGMILATQALKLILHGQSSLEGKMLVYDGRKCEFKKLQLRKKLPKCLACSVQKLQMKTYDYAKYLGCKPNPPPEVTSISWQNYVQNHSSEKILDVRPYNLYNILHFKNSINIPFEVLSKLDKESILQKVGVNAPFFVSCARGVMSRHALKYLQSLRLDGTNISGGINGYRVTCDPSLPEI